MGWVSGDEETVNDLRVLLSKVKNETYLFQRNIQRINHPEKGPRLIQLSEELWKKLDEIEFQLNR